MPDLNPGVVVSSPFLSDEFQVTRVGTTINDKGRTVVAGMQNLCGFGIVTNAGAADLKRLDDYQEADNVIKVITETELRGPTPGAQPDVITWAGTSYLVRKTWPYPRFGQGWYIALAISQNAVDIMPEPIDGQ